MRVYRCAEAVPPSSVELWETGNACPGNVERRAACRMGCLQQRLSRHSRMRYAEEEQEENMENSNIHPFWKWTWKALCSLLTLSILFFPIAILLAVIAEVVIQPMLNPY